MYKLSFKEAEELEIKLPTLDYGESRRVPEKHVFLFNDYAKAFVWITTNWKILKKIGLPDYLTYLLRNLYIRSNSQKKKRRRRSNSQNWTRTTGWFKIGKRVQHLICRVHHVKCQAG